MDGHDIEAAQEDEGRVADDSEPVVQNPQAHTYRRDGEASPRDVALVPPEPEFRHHGISRHCESDLTGKIKE